MLKRLLALMALTVFLAACTVDAGEGLMDLTFNREKPLSDTFYVDIAKDVSAVEFIVKAQLDLGSTTIFVYEPNGETHTLALGLVDSTQILELKDPRPGRWLVEIHVDGNSETLVDGEVSLSIRKR